MNFRIVHLLYVIAVIGSSLATFGVGGVVLAGFIVGFWSIVFAGGSRPKTFRVMLAASLLVVCLICCLFPAVPAAREAARRAICSNNLKQIGYALLNYHDTYGSFPPAYVVNDNGVPMHSWRVLILPFIEEQSLYEQYDFDEPWDGPNNRQLLSRMPEVFACPTYSGRQAAAEYATSYVAVVDPRCAWSGSEARTVDEFKDGTSHTLMVIEAGGLRIPWLKPDDPGLSEAIDLLTSSDVKAGNGHCSEDFFYVYSVGRNVLMADASVHFLVDGTDPDIVRGFLQLDDGQQFDDTLPSRDRSPSKRPKFDNWFRLTLFLLIAAFPTPWVWLNPTGSN